MFKFDIFFEILQVAVGIRTELSYIPTIAEWSEIYKQAERQSLIGISFYGVQKLPVEQKKNIPKQLKMQWLGMTVYIQRKNDVMNQRCRELQNLLSSWGLRFCILKGQGVALLYNDNSTTARHIGSFRQSGDIDIWVEGNVNDIVHVFLKNNIQLEKINSVHADANLFKDTHVEVHFRPSWFFNPCTERKFNKWVTESKNIQMANECNGLFVPVIGFNIVFLLLHIYRHLFNEGIGLRQVMDYFMMLKSISNDCQEFSKAVDTIKSLGMERFACALSWVMQEVFIGHNRDKGTILEFSEGILLFYHFFPPTPNEGSFLLSEIMKGGNFGKYDTRIRHSHKSLFASGVASIKRNIKFLRHYYSEIIWMPYWKLWHWRWRKRKGYL